MSQHDQHPDAPAQALRDPGHPRRAGPRSLDRRDHAADLCQLHLHPGKPRVHKGLDYGRSHNPTRWALERCVADLEGGAQAFAFASGLAAISSVLELLDAGSHIVSGNDLYGGTFRLFERVRRRSAGHRFSFVDPTDLQALRGRADPGNPHGLGGNPEQPAAAPHRPARHRPALPRPRHHQRGRQHLRQSLHPAPLELGFDVVVHSTTKYLNGHSDVIGGIAIVGDNPDLRERLGFLQNSVGAISGPFDAFLTLRGVKTLALRMERHCSNALALAQWLERQPQVARVYYPGLASHPQHELAKRQMRGFGGMISLDLRCDLAGARRFLENVRIFSLAESLGGVEKPDRASGDHDPRQHPGGNPCRTGHR